MLERTPVIRDQRASFQSIEKIESIDYTDLAQAWRTYREEIRDQSDALFSEYVEFLGGLALRDTGLGGLLPSPLPQPAPRLSETTL